MKVSFKRRRFGGFGVWGLGGRAFCVTFCWVYMFFKGGSKHQGVMYLGVHVVRMLPRCIHVGVV